MTKKKNQYYSTWAERSDYGDYIDDVEGVSISRADRQFLDVDTNVSIRSEFLRSDYDYYRSGSVTPDKPQDIIKLCMKAYSRVGIVRNVIDLMADFGCQGIKLEHPNPTIQRFYNKWFQKVRGVDRSERWLNLFYRCGIVLVHPVFGKLPKSKEKEWKKAHADFTDVKTLKRDIPITYNFINPLSLRLIGEEASNFIGKPRYALKLSSSLKTSMARMQKIDPDFSIPEDILSALKSGKGEYVFPAEKLKVYHYKKDDWQPWAEPMTYCIFDDLVAYEKMRLADLAALDGAISNIRLWRLGFIDTTNPANSLIPSRSVINKLRNILHNNVGGGTIDLVWGPELDFKESNSQVYKWLGSAKYESTLNAIYDGLGVPPTLRSGSKGSSGGSASFIALKTLIKRLQYGQGVLKEFWDEQIKIVQQAMGFDSPAQVSFSRMIMSDESTELQLLINLADRDLISNESLMERFDMLPDIEKLRISRESRKRGKSSPEKASPFHNPLWAAKLKEQLLLQGRIDPINLGLNFDVKPPVPVTGTPGRPNNVVETQKRKPKPVGKPQTAKSENSELSNAYTWATETYKDICTRISPALLKSFGKKNFRQLTNEESTQSEYIKFSAMFGFDMYEDITNEKIFENMKTTTVTEEAKKTFSYLIKAFVTKNSRQPTVDEVRQIYINTFIIEKFLA
jgi:hypothetical protein